MDDRIARAVCGDGARVRPASAEQAVVVLQKYARGYLARKRCLALLVDRFNAVRGKKSTR